VDRRTTLSLLAASAALPLVGCNRTGGADAETRGSTAPKELAVQRMPTIFVAHGAPPLLDDALWMAELRAWADAMPRPAAVLMISAHWLDQPVTLGATRTVPLVYDFYGFPKRFYEMTYPAPGAPELARRVRELVGAAQPVADDAERGLDHGAWVPLMAMYPNADVPVLQMSIPTMDPTALLELGRALAPLRNEGVLVFGSGFLTHNMRSLDFAGGKPPGWASEFDAWAAEALARRDVDALATYRERAPAVEMALPTHEHFVPVLVAAGASMAESDAVRFPITGFAFGSFTKRSVQFG
jgi:4,5-DOPA dioxygenase extradiol